MFRSIIFLGLLVGAVASAESLIKKGSHLVLVDASYDNVNASRNSSLGLKHMAFGFTYGYSVLDYLSLGASLNYVEHNMDVGPTLPDVETGLLSLSAVARSNIALSDAAYFAPELKFGGTSAGVTTHYLGETLSSYSGFHVGGAARFGTKLPTSETAATIVETSVGYTQHWLSQSATVKRFRLGISVGRQF